MSTTPGYRGRFAPSPTGPLHAGSLLAALGSWLMARRAGGRWLVRIEDLDPPREVPGAAAAQLRTLATCGLHPDGPVEYQSRRGGLYAAALERLLAAGDAFECHCSRSDLGARGGIHRHCVAGRRRPDPAVRLRVPDGCRIGFEDAIRGHYAQDLAREVGDFVLRRADGPWAYQLAVVVDDADQGITEVVRGADLLDSTARQILLQQRLGLPTPRYAHLPVVPGPDGRKLSKSLAAMPVDDADPLPALARAWAMLGQDPAAVAGAASPAALLEAALAAFDPARIPRGPDPLPAALHNTHGAIED
ncbi:tRNA glutamyl-Q(34) synthetase GluQRS [Luteimonas sp. J29]|nr:tRNA glutamyl-Q(34) synthetase GluQRS [Luteimonas sp. J29]